MSISRSLEFELGVQAFEIPVDQRDRDFFSATPKNDRAIPLLQIAIHLDVSLHQNRILADDMHLDAAGPERRGDLEADEAGPNDDSALRANRSGYEVTAVSCGAQIVHMWEGGAGNIERSEEGRVGKGGVGTGRSWGAPRH